MKEFIMSFNHWWVYLCIAYYLTWLITYQTLVYKTLLIKKGALYSIWKYIKFLCEGVTEETEKPIIRIGNILIIVFLIIWIIICSAWLVFCWAFITAAGFIPLANNVASSCKIWVDDDGNGSYEFEYADYKDTPIIKGWIWFFKGLFLVIAYPIYKVCNIKIREKIT